MIKTEKKQKRKWKKFINIAQIRHLDLGLLMPMIILVGTGILAIYSASIYSTYYNGSSPLRYLIIQIVGGCIGLGIYFALAVIPYKKYLQPPVIIGALVACFILLIVVLFTPPVLGASRWIDLGLVNFQPSELTKIVFVLFISWWFVAFEQPCYQGGLELCRLFSLGVKAPFQATARQQFKKIATSKKKWTQNLVFWGIPLFVTLAIMVLLILEPDNGSMVIIFVLFATVFSILFIRKKGAKIILSLLLVAGALLIFNKDAVVGFALKALEGQDSHIAVRFNAWLDPFADYSGDGYQLANSYIAIAKGGVTGAGLGNGTQKQGFLPEGHTDFILANIAEETGLIGIGFILLTFYHILHRAFKVAVRVEDKQAKLTIFGLIVLFFIQFFWNAGGISGLLPMKGLSIPFLGYGGTSIVFMISTLGIIQSIATTTNYQAAKRLETTPNDTI